MSALNIDAYHRASLVVTPIVNGSYHEGFFRLSLSGLEMRRGCLRLLKFHECSCIIVDVDDWSPNNNVSVDEGIIRGK